MIVEKKVLNQLKKSAFKINNIKLVTDASMTDCQS